MTIFGRGIEREISKRQEVDVLASRLFLERSRASNISCSGDRMYAFGGPVTEVSCGVWWIVGAAVGNCY